MKLEMRIVAKNPNYRISKFYINGELICNTLEDTDRGLHNWDPLKDIAEAKVFGQTAIPVGVYEIGQRFSPKFSNSAGIIKVFGKPRALYNVLDVPGWKNVLLHSGNKPEDTEGCILFGKNNVVGQVTNSVYWTYEVLYKRLDEVFGKEPITLEIK